MLSGLRSGGTGQALMGVMVTAIIAVFIIEFRSTASRQTGSIRRECAAKIDGECITPKDYYAEFGLIVPRGLSQKQIKAYSLRREVLDGIVERELLAEEARRLGIGVDEEATKSELRLGRAHVSLPAATALRLGFMLDLVSADETGISRYLVRELPVIDPKSGEVDDDLYARVVRSMSNRSPKEFLKMQEKELLAATMRDAVMAPVRVSNDEAFEAFQREKSKAVIRSVKIDTEWFARYAVDASDEAVDRWSFDHKTEVDDAWKNESSKWKAGCTLAAEVLAGFASDTSEVEKSAAKDKMDRAKSLLDSGESFALVARELSDAPSGVSGGDAGCVSEEAYGEGGDALEKALASVPSGGVSAVIETKTGYHLLKSEGKLASTDVEKLGRRAVARRLAVRALGTDLAKDFGKKLIDAARSGARLDDTARALVLDFAKPSLAASGKKPKKSEASKTEGAAETTEDQPPIRDSRAPKMEVSAPFALDGDPVPGVYGADSLARAAFALEKPDDVTPEPIAIAGGFLVIQLKEKTLATREDFASQKTEVIRKIEIAKRSQTLTDYVARLRAAKKDRIELSDRILEEPKNADKD